MSNNAYYTVKCTDYKGLGTPTSETEMYTALTLEQAQFVRDRAINTNIWRTVYITGGPEAKVGS